jgi:hypothetical protein
VNGWAIYFDALHEPIAGSVQGGVAAFDTNGRKGHTATLIAP